MTSLPVSDTAIPQASLIGIPCGIRVHIFENLFLGVIFQVWYDDDGCGAYMDRHETAIIYTCRQVNTEALPVLLENLELIFEWFPVRNALAQVPPDIKKLVLPHLRHLTFARSDFKLTVPVEEFRSVTTCLKVVDLGSTTIRLRLSTPQMYDATVNKLLAWPLQSSHGATPVWSFNRYLMTVTLNSSFAAGNSGHHGTSPWLRPLLADQSRKFSLIGRVCDAWIDEQGRYLEIHLTFDLDTFAVLDRHVTHGPFPLMLDTVRYARVCMFGRRRTVLEGETAAQGEHGKTKAAC